VGPIGFVEWRGVSTRLLGLELEERRKDYEINKDELK